MKCIQPRDFGVNQRCVSNALSPTCQERTKQYMCTFFKRLFHEKKILHVFVCTTYLKVIKITNKTENFLPQDRGV